MNKHISITDQTEVPCCSPADGSPEVQRSCPPGSWPGMRWNATEVASASLGPQTTGVRSRLLRHTTHLFCTVCRDIGTHVLCAITPMPSIPSTCTVYLSLQICHFSVSTQLNSFPIRLRKVGLGGTSWRGADWSERGADAAAASLSARPADANMKWRMTNSRGRLDSIQGCHLSQTANYQQLQPLWVSDNMCR